MRYTVQHIATIVSGSLKGQTSGFIEHLLLDSRQVIFPQTALFFALVGKRHDGHHYIGQLYAEGLRHFVVSKPLPWSDYPEASFIQVEDTLKGLQQLAYYHRHQFPLKTIGITGSNGKTIVKEWLFDLLHLDFRIVRSPKSYNSQIGVPLSVWQIRP